jgi:YVTN family beta-propeller protein
MMKKRKLFYLLIIVIIIGFISVPARKKARKHVDYITATNDHPLNCLSCHLYTQRSGFLAKMINADYLSPYNLAISPDGKRLYVVAQEGNKLLVVDTKTDKVIDKIAVGTQPHTVVITHDGKRAFVSNEWDDTVYIIDLATSNVTDTIKTGNGPAGMVLNNDENNLYVISSFSNEISIFDLKTNKEIKRLLTGNNPAGAAISPDGTKVYVTSRRILPREYRKPISIEITVIDTKKQRVTERKILKDAYLSENVSFTPTGDLAIATLIRPKNLIPSIQVEQGFMMTHGIGIMETKKGGRIVQLLTDEPNAYYSDPFDIVITPDGQKAFVSSGGTDIVSVIDLNKVRKLMAESTCETMKEYSNNLGISSKYVIKRISTGNNPKGMKISPDGKYVYVAERLNDKIAVINTETLEIERNINLGGPKRVTVARQGRRLFNSAGHTFQNQYACYTCHPDVGEDGLVYNMAGVGMGRNVTNTQTLRDIGDIAPYKWNGHNQSVYKQDGMRFSTFLTRTEPFNYDDLDALVAYIITGIKNPPNLRYNATGKLTEAQKRGKKIFYRTHTNCGKNIPPHNRCYTCHPPPDFTNKQFEDVGSLSETDDTIKFDTPQLNNLFNAAPYLHDGRAQTLEEIWTTYDHGDHHGVTSDMTKDQLNDMIEYLKSLRDAKYYENVDIEKEVEINNSK